MARREFIEEFQPDILRCIQIHIQRVPAFDALEVRIVSIVLVHAVAIRATTRLTRMIRPNLLERDAKLFEFVLYVLLGTTEQPLLELDRVRDTLTSYW